MAGPALAGGVAKVRVELLLVPLPPLLEEDVVLEADDHLAVHETSTPGLDREDGRRRLRLDPQLLGQFGQ